MDFGRWAIVLFLFAAEAAFLIFRRAALRCLVLAIEPPKFCFLDAGDVLLVGVPYCFHGKIPEPDFTLDMKLA